MQPHAICSVPECSKPTEARGLCPLHYRRLWAYGTTELTTPNQETRFWAKVDKSGGADACWPWLAAKDMGGYGLFRISKPVRRYPKAHRVAYEWCVGPIPQGMTLDHLCRNRACVNPAHLEPVSQRENTWRGTSPVALNAQKLFCKRGHPLAGRNLVVSKDGSRHCGACSNMHARARRAARGAKSRGPYKGSRG